MFSMPTSFSDFFIKVLKSLPYVAVLNGFLFAAIGLYFINSSSNFTTKSVMEQLRVVSVESRKSKNGVVYRPLFEARRDDGGSIRYSGTTWVSPKPHEEGDIVDGRVNWTTGEIRSVGMMKFHTVMGKIFAVSGGIIFLLGGIYLSRKKLRSLLVRGD